MPESAPPECPVCQGIIEVKLAIGRKSGKPSLSLVCPADARHYRGFINDRAYVQNVLSHRDDVQGSEDARDN